MRNLPSYDFDLLAGWSTNLNPRTVTGKGLLQAINVHHNEEYRSIGKMYGTAVVSPSLGASVKSLHYFEYTDLGFQRQRDIVAIANGAFRTFDSATSWATETLPTGATLTNEAMAGATMLNRLHLTSKGQRGLSTGGLKFDGIRVTNWGIKPPGSTETALETFDDNTDWTAGSESTLANEATRTIDGGGSTKLTKTGGASVFATLAQASLSHDVSGAGQDAGFMYVYLESGVLQLLEQTETGGAQNDAAVCMNVTNNGASNFTNSAFFNFSVGDLVPGWNLLTWVWDSPTGTTGTGWTSAATIGSIQLVVRTNAAATLISGDQFVLFDNLYIVDEGALTATDSGSGSGPSGSALSYVVTYLTEYGVESNAGPASTSLSDPGGDQVNLTAIPTSSDDQVIARRIYRDQAGDGIYLFVTQIDDNETTTFSDTIVDTARGTAQPPFAGDSLFDNSPPGRLTSVVESGDRLWGIDADNENIVKISENNGPETWRIVDQLIFDDRIVALEPWQQGILAYATDRVHFITGDGGFTPFNSAVFGQSNMGANGFRSVGRSKGGHFAVHEHRVHYISGPVDPWMLNSPIYDQWAGLSIGDLENLHMVVDDGETRAVFFAKDNGSSTFDKIFVYQWGTSAEQSITGDGPGVDPLDVRAGRWFELALNSTQDPQCSAIVERTADKPEVWFGDDDGYVYYLDPTSTELAVGGSSAETVSMTLETQWVPLDAQEGSRGVTRGEPRYLRFHQSGTSAAITYTITVTLARDPDVSNTSQITTSWSQAITGEESLIVPVPMQGAGRFEWAKVKLVTTTAGTPVIRGLELFYIPRVDFSGPRT